jgi:hypothetical protein
MAHTNPPEVKTQTIKVAIKSFIAVIGSQVGTVPGVATIPIPIPPFEIIPVPVPRQTLLQILAKLTDEAFSEDPVTAANDKHYRLFSSCEFTVSWSNRKLLDVTVSALDTDVGKERPFQPPPLIASPVTTSFAGPSTFTFLWTGKGRPHLAVEPTFQAVHARTSVFIWHTIHGQINVAGGFPLVSGTLDGSEFPSHRVFVDGKVANVPLELRQGVFSNLWVPDPSDPTKVR